MAKKDLTKFHMMARDMSDSSTQNRDVNKLAVLLMIESALEDILEEMKKSQKTTAKKETAK